MLVRDEDENTTNFVSRVRVGVRQCDFTKVLWGHPLGFAS
jgi:hypothetical protein